jgi:hypothetical protein
MPPPFQHSGTRVSVTNAGSDDEADPELDEDMIMVVAAKSSSMPWSAGWGGIDPWLSLPLKGISALLVNLCRRSVGER